MGTDLSEEVSSMCYERYLRRRRAEDEESRELWQDFDRTRPIADPEPRVDAPEPERLEEREEVSAPEG